MLLGRRHTIIIWLSITLLIGPWGCAHAPAPLSEQVRAQLGTVGVVSARFIPEAEFQTPAKGWAGGAGRGAPRGAVQGFGSSLRVFAELGRGCSEPVLCGAALLVGLGILAAATTVGTVVGAVHGAATAEPAAKVAEEEAALKNALAGLKIQEAIRDYVIQVALEQTRHLLVVLSDQGPTALDEKISYRAPASQAIDTVLEVSVLSLGLTGEWAVNQPLAVFMTARSRLIRISDGAELYALPLEYSSGTRTFTEWAANNAQPFREELDRAYQNIAERIVELHFLRYAWPE